MLAITIFHYDTGDDEEQASVRHVHKSHKGGRAPQVHPLPRQPPQDHPQQEDHHDHPDRDRRHQGQDVRAQAWHQARLPDQHPGGGGQVHSERGREKVLPGVCQHYQVH